MHSVYSPEYSRNMGFWSEDEQAALMAASVAIAGVGGDGFQLGQKLARMGVQDFSIADPETFEPENVNRVPGATTQTYGHNKAQVFANMVHEINPDATVRVYTDGITPDNIEEFMSRATLAFDETELTHLDLGTMVSDQARERGIPNVLVMNVGFAAQFTSFRPEGRQSFRRLMGIPEDMPLDEVREQTLDLSRCLPYLPKYVDLETLKAVQTDPDAPLPSIAQGVDIASAVASSQAFLHMTRGVKNNRPEPVWAPRFGYMDAMTLESGTIRFPRASFMYRGMVMTARNRLGMNPKANFSREDRDRQAREYQASRGIIQP
jgi:molybdopterin/thiamine biosynthesis adenylyltransferase